MAAVNKVCIKCSAEFMGNSSITICPRCSAPKSTLHGIIIKVDKPGKGDQGYRGGIYRIHYVDSAFECYWHKDVFASEYFRIMFENELTKCGITQRDVDEYRRLVSTEVLEEEGSNRSGGM